MTATATATAPARRRSTFRRVATWSGGVLGALLVLIVGFAAWLLFTTSGARWVANLVTSRFAPQVKYASIDGTIAGTLTVHDFRFEGPPDAARIRIARMTVKPTLSMLLSRVVRIEHARVEGLVLTLPEQSKPSEDEDGPLWVEPPLDIVVDDFALLDGRVVQGRESWFAVKQLGVAARWSRRELLIERLSLLPGDIAGSLNVKGRITPAGDLIRGAIDARWSEVVIPGKLAGREIVTQGAVRFDGTPVQYRVTGALDAGPRGALTHMVLDVAGTDQAATIKRLDLTQRAGSLLLRGTVAFAPGIGWDLNARARDFDPGELLADWRGRLNLDLTTTGQASEAGPSGTLRIDSLSGELRGRPVAGGGQLAFTAPSSVTGSLEVRSGRSRIAVQGADVQARRIDATVDLAVASLNDWVPESGGSLQGHFRVRGVWPKLDIAGVADGKSLGFGANEVARLHVEAKIGSPLAPQGKLRVTASEVTAAGLAFAKVTIEGSGNQEEHRVTLDARGEKLSAGVTISGGLAQGAWRGELSRLDLEAPDLAKLALRAPARLSLGAGVFEITQACLVDASSALCAAARAEESGALTASYSFENVPLGLANSLAPEALPGQLRGALAGRGEVRRTADGRWFGAAQMRSPSARIVLLDEAQAAAVLGQRTLLIYENLDLHAKLEGTQASATLNAGLQDGGTLHAALGANDLMAEAPALRGTVTASIPTLAPFGAFVPTVANLDGAVRAEVIIGGTVAAPEITGNVDATKLQADLGNLGVELRDGRLRAEARRGGGFMLAGGVASGKGRVELEGTMSARGQVEAQIHGTNFVAANIPAANVIVSPELQLTGDSQGYLLRGDVTVPRADINIQKMPQDEAPGVSPDVVVVRNGKEETRAQEASALPLTANVTVKLGDAIKVTGYGLDATVAGQLVVRESPGAPTTGSGTLDVSGRYKAYGQDLTVKDGRLLFAGTPLDNPRLDLIAMREINDDLSTGLRIAGSAQRPIITVISDPNVGEADALSYLVTGRSLNEVGSASGSSQDALASATRSLEGAGAGLVAKRIGKRLGLDEATVEENEMIGGSALTVGEYLSPRLYLSYGVGLFDPGEVIALRYKLSDDVGVRVQRGSQETRAGVEYRIEK